MTIRDSTDYNRVLLYSALLQGGGAPPKVSMLQASYDLQSGKLARWLLKVYGTRTTNPNPQPQSTLDRALDSVQGLGFRDLFIYIHTHIQHRWNPSFHLIFPV